MATGWRIVPEARASDAFTGEGARLYGGRWNSPGTSMVYISEFKSLAALELLVHVDPRRPRRYKAFFLEWDDRLIGRKRITEMPADWRDEPPSPTTMQIGDEWVRGARSAVLAVPSVIIPEEWNYLLNPAHPDFGKINIGSATDFTFDPRLLS